VPLADRLGSFLANALFSASPSVLVYLGGGSENSRLTWLDRKGPALGSVGDAGYYTSVAISPDGKQAALTRLEYSNISIDLWLLDFARETSTRLTFGPGFSQDPVWSPDGTRLAYRAQREGGDNLFMKLTSGAQNEELLLKSPEPKIPSDWSRDGRYLLYSATNAKTHSDLWALPLEDRKPFPFLATEFNETDGHFSPDGKWIAYVSNETGRDEVWVRAFSPRAADSKNASEVTGKWLVSKGGGYAPDWLENGELTYTSPEFKLMAVAITPGPVFRSATPVELFPWPPGMTAGVPAPNGRILAAIPVRKVTQEPLTVVLNWQAALKK
jgi:Tol biopolymer transport system component